MSEHSERSVLREVRRHLVAAWIVALGISAIGAAVAAEWQHHRKAPGTQDERAGYLLKDPTMQSYPDEP
jgi:hypothetical protein